MLFNSYDYILFFLPAVVSAYAFFTNKKKALIANWVLLIASFAFCAFADIRFAMVLFASIVMNYIFIGLLQRPGPPRRAVLFFGVSSNIALLGFFKYAGFILTMAGLPDTAVQSATVMPQPLGISFYSFIQIACLVDVYRKATRAESLMSYGTFAGLFPYMIAGPIVRHDQTVAQLQGSLGGEFNYGNCARGVFLFFTGLAKKAIIADSVAVIANAGFDGGLRLCALDSWVAGFAFTLQIYFDFSGYTDMARGSALMLNIRIPDNFNTPYRSLDIQDFWRRWHITLGNFLRDYLYIPLGGSRISEARTLLNLMITFFVCGVWHGAGWTFIVWGLLHGGAMVVHRLWKKTGVVLPRFLSWLITLNFVNAAWVFFRARTMKDALSMLGGMAGLHQGGAHVYTNHWFVDAFDTGSKQFLRRMDHINMNIVLLVAAFLVSIAWLNSDDIQERFRSTPAMLVALIIIAVFSIYNLSAYAGFIYANF